MHMMCVRVCVCERLCVCLCLVAVFNIDVSWPLFVAEGNREYEHRLFFIYLSGLSFHHLPLFQPSIPPSLHLPLSFTLTHTITLHLAAVLRTFKLYSKLKMPFNIC